MDKTSWTYGSNSFCGNQCVTKELGQVRTLDLQKLCERIFIANFGLQLMWLNLFKVFKF